MDHQGKAKHIYEAGGDEVATSAGGGHTYQKPLKSFRFADVRYLLTQSSESWSKHKAPRLGASLAFYTLLSLTPLLLVVVAVVGLVFGHRTAQHEIVKQVQMLVGTQGAEAIDALLKGSRNSTQGIIATVAGLLTLLFSASGVMIELRDALNTIWEIPMPPSAGIRSKIVAYVRNRLLSFAMVLSVGFLLGGVPGGDFVDRGCRCAFGLDSAFDRGPVAHRELVDIVRVDYVCVCGHL